MPRADDDAPRTSTGAATATGSIPAPEFGAPPTTSTGGSKGSGTSKAASKKSAIATLRRYFTNLGLPSSLANWAYGLLRSGYDMEGVKAELYRRPEFKRRFSGIFRQDGSLITSPSDYLQLTEAYQSLATQYGFKLSRGQAGKLVNLEVSPEEFRTRARAGQTILTNPQMVEFLNQQVAVANQKRKAAGQALLGPVRNAKEAMNFVLGQSDLVVYELYEGARISALSGGLISADRARALAHATEGVLRDEEITQRMRELQHNLNLAGVEFQAAGIDKTMLENAFFGVGVNQVSALAKIEQVVRNRQAQIQNETVGEQTQLRAGRPVSGLEQEPGL